MRAAILTLAVLCPIGNATAQQAPHFPHESRFGGIFASAAGDALHLEGIWAAQRRFKLLVIDGSGAPLTLDQLRSMRGKVVAGGRETPLVLLEADSYFEARIPTLTLPATIAVQFQSSPTASIEGLTFTFAGYSIDTSGDAAEAPIEIPATLEGIIQALRIDQQDGRARVARGDLSALTESEHRIRELVTALEPYVSARPEESRRGAEAARLRVMRGVWLLHIAFDYGNAAQTREAFSRLSAAIDDTIAAFGGVAQ